MKWLESHKANFQGKLNWRYRFSSEHDSLFEIVVPRWLVAKGKDSAYSTFSFDRDECFWGESGYCFELIWS